MEEFFYMLKCRKSTYFAHIFNLTVGDSIFGINILHNK